MANSGWSANGYGASKGWNTFPPSAGSNFVRPPTFQQTPGFQAGGRNMQGGYGSGNIGGVDGTGFDMGLNGSWSGLYMDACTMGGFDMGAVNGGGIGMGAGYGGGFGLGAVNGGGMNRDNGGGFRMVSENEGGMGYSMNGVSRWGGDMGTVNRSGYDMGAVNGGGYGMGAVNGGGYGMGAVNGGGYGMGAVNGCGYGMGAVNGGGYGMGAVNGGGYDMSAVDGRAMYMSGSTSFQTHAGPDAEYSSFHSNGMQGRLHQGQRYLVSGRLQPTSDCTDPNSWPVNNYKSASRFQSPNPVSGSSPHLSLPFQCSTGSYPGHNTSAIHPSSSNTTFTTLPSAARQNYSNGPGYSSANALQQYNSSPPSTSTSAPAPAPAPTSASTSTSAPAADLDLRQCSNCGTRFTSIWRRDMVDNSCVCNACGLFQKANGARRTPTKARKRKAPTKVQTNSKCINCSTTSTTLWRQDANGNPLCNACGLYFKIHKKNRSPDMIKDTIKRRRRWICKKRKTTKTSPPSNPDDNQPSTSG